MYPGCAVVQGTWEPVGKRRNRKGSHCALSSALYLPMRQPSKTAPCSPPGFAYNVESRNIPARRDITVIPTSRELLGFSDAG